MQTKRRGEDGGRELEELIFFSTFSRIQSHTHVSLHACETEDVMIWDAKHWRQHKHEREGVDFLISA